MGTSTPLQPNEAWPGVTMGCWRIIKATPKTVTIIYHEPSDAYQKGSGRFTYKWDGSGYKRQGQYLRQDGVS